MPVSLTGYTGVFIMLGAQDGRSIRLAQERPFQVASGWYPFMIFGSKPATSSPAAQEIKRWVGVIVLTTLVVVIGGIVYTLRSPNVYEASAGIYIQQDNPIGSLRGILPDTIATVARTASAADPGGYALAILNSQDFARQMVKAMDLKSDRDFIGRHQEKDLTVQEASEMLLKRITVDDNRRGLITIRARAYSRKLAADIANTYVKEFQARVDTRNKRKRQFTEKKLIEMREDLEALELRAKKFSEKHQVVDLPEQSKAAVMQIATLQQQMLTLELQLGAVESELTTSGSLDELARLKAEQESLLVRKAELEQAVSRAQEGLRNLPGVGLELASLKREIQLKEALFQSLAQQHQLALIEEQSEAGVYQQVDTAVPPRFRYSPRMSVNLVASFVLGVMLGVALNLGISYWQAYVDLARGGSGTRR